ncbi:hypothetical protein A3K87_24065 [Variovorax paradoxus]|uniref:Uncharacterized protein n=2 Tax=Variovorax paradoxus TaxID=34073 RepID=A0AA91I966_VARPD|nr:hypothetical protein A3K87_24065 [Variovorax paradoxus]
MVMAAAIACGVDFGIYRSRGPRNVFFISGAGHFEADWHRLNSISRMPEFAAASALLERNLHFYHREHEQDPCVDLGSVVAQEAMRKSMPNGVDLIIVDWVPAFMRTKMGKLRPIPPYAWFNELNNEGIAVVAFDVLRTADRPPASETVAASTAYLTEDPHAPAQFGGGFLIERWRVGDPDYAARRSSFWHTIIGDEFEYGFSLADPDHVEKAGEIRKTEREIKLEVMLAQGIPQKDIAAELGVHKSTITRMKQEMEKAAKAEAEAEARDPRSQMNSWENVIPLGKHLREARRLEGGDGTAQS